METCKVGVKDAIAIYDEYNLQSVTSIFRSSHQGYFIVIIEDLQQDSSMDFITEAELLERFPKIDEDNMLDLI